MTAQEYIESRVAPEFQEKATVIGLIGEDKQNGIVICEGNWWHVHRDEEIPTHVYVKISESWE